VTVYTRRILVGSKDKRENCAHYLCYVCLSARW